MKSVTNRPIVKLVKYNNKVFSLRMPMFRSNKKFLSVGSSVGALQMFKYISFLHTFFPPYGSTALYGPGPPRFVEVSWSHTSETHHSR